MTPTELRELLARRVPEERLAELFARYMAAQFNGTGQRPVARIPATEADDDFALSAVFDGYRAAVNSLPALLDEIEQLRLVREAAEELIEQVGTEVSDWRDVFVAWPMIVVLGFVVLAFLGACDPSVRHWLDSKA